MCYVEPAVGLAYGLINALGVIVYLYNMVFETKTRLSSDFNTSRFSSCMMYSKSSGSADRMYRQTASRNRAALSTPFVAGADTVGGHYSNNHKRRKVLNQWTERVRICWAEWDLVDI